MLTSYTLKNYFRSKTNINNLALLCVLLAGIGILLRDFLALRSFWLDEAALALNFARSFRELAEPLGGGQLAPILFLFFVKALTLVFGAKDYVMRIVPLLFGIGSITFFYLILKKIFDGFSSILALSIYVLSERIINYSTEFKQYSAEIFFPLLLFYIFIKIRENRLDIKKSVLLMITGVIALWFSSTTIVVLPALALILLVETLNKKRKKEIINFIVIVVFWLASMSALYLFYRLNNSAVLAMNNYWQSAFMPIFPKNLQEFLWLPISIRDFFVFVYKIDANLFSADYPIVKNILFLVLFLFSITCSIKYFKKLYYLIIFTAALFIFSILLSALRIYPFYERTVLFIAPFIIILIAFGLFQILLLLFKAHRSLPVIFLILFFMLPLVVRIYYVIEPPYRSEIKPVINYYYENKKNGDLLYVENYYYHQFEFYSDKKQIDFTNDKDYSLLKKELSGKRVWVIGDIGDIKNQAQIRNHYKVKTLAEKISERITIESISNKIRHFNNPGVEITLYDFTNQ